MSPSSVRPLADAPLLVSAPESARRFASYTPGAAAPKRLQTIDGLRAMAISMVFLNHASGTIAFPALLAAVSRDSRFGLAGHGVKCFFVISGFLITSILLRELDRDGTIDQLAFIRRRARRLLPTLVAFVVAAGLLRWIGVYSFAPRQLGEALAFTGRLDSWELGHLWSMAVQEQFYLAWVVILVVGGRAFATHCAVAALVLLPIARVVHATLHPDAPSLYLTNGASIDTLAFGCLLALHRDRLATSRWFNAAVESRVSVPLLYMLGGAAVAIGWRPGVLLRTPVLTAAIVLILERCIRHPDRGFARMLASRGVVYVGTASYSLYLWQQLFLNPASTSPVTAFPLNIVAAVAVGLLSWHLIERPFSARSLGVSGVIGAMRFRVPLAAVVPSISAAARIESRSRSTAA